tara:strand:- start:230 stop:451 length:222 start_codon:yes stop_codon:yes gene_type:complete
MKNEKVIRDLLELNEEVEIDSSEDLEEYGFDSLASVSLITYLSQNSSADIEPEDIESLVTMKDLDDFISEKIS